MEFVQGENVTINSDSIYIQKNMELIYSCINNKEGQQKVIQWQWWLGRLVFLKRLFDDHRSLLLQTSNENLVNSSFPVSPRSDTDLTELLNYLEENVLAEVSFSSNTEERLFSLVNFFVSGISSTHKKVHKLAVSLLVQCICVASQDVNLFSRIRGIILGLKTNVQSVLHRHLSTEAQREQADMLNILDEHHEIESKIISNDLF